MKQTDIVRKMFCEGHPVDITVGDVVWWFPEGQTDNPPHVATIVRFSDDQMVDLSYNNFTSSRLTNVTGVCMLGDDKLNNANYRKRGAWCPRGLWSFLNLK